MGGSSKGGGGGGTVFQPQDYTRTQSQQELEYLQRQRELMDMGLAVAREQEARSNQMYNDYNNIYRPIETGLIQPGATRENGYYSPNLFKPPPREVASRQEPDWGAGAPTAAEQNGIDYQGGGLDSVFRAMIDSVERRK